MKSEEGPISVMIIKSCLLSDSAMFLRKMQPRPRQKASKQTNKTLQTPELTPWWQMPEAFVAFQEPQIAWGYRQGTLTLDC